MAKKKIIYVEPDDFFPREIREEFKIGEYAEAKPKGKKSTKKTTKKK